MTNHEQLCKLYKDLNDLKLSSEFQLSKKIYWLPIILKLTPYEKGILGACQKMRNSFQTQLNGFTSLLHILLSPLCLAKVFNLGPETETINYQPRGLNIKTILLFVIL